jgi:hypothetical protein
MRIGRQEVCSMFTRCRHALLIFAMVFVAACTARSFEVPHGHTEKVSIAHYPQTLEKDVDILFVVDNSQSMDPHQANLRQNFERLISALRSQKLGGQLPNVHIGVVNTDVGIGTSLDPEWTGCSVLGTDGQLQASKSCNVPANYITHIDGKTNIAGCKADPAACVTEAFKCVADQGVEGCGLEAPLEAAWRALDPQKNRNPGFLRKDALLAIVFITDEDDCSMQLRGNTPPFFTRPDVPIGVRCADLAFACAEHGAGAWHGGKRTQCKPRSDYLVSVDEYVKRFASLKTNKERIIMAAISGPDAALELIPTGDDTKFAIFPSCSRQDKTTGNMLEADPALRLNAVVRAFSGQHTAVCEADFGPALQKIGERIIASLGGQCVISPLLLRNDGIACKRGVPGCRMPSCKPGETCDGKSGFCISASGELTQRYCGESCLDAVECQLTEVSDQGTLREKEVEIPKCPRELFNDSALPVDACGDHCPCWRLIERGEQCTKLGASPFGFQIMRRDQPRRGAIAVAHCVNATFGWNDPQVQNAEAHCTAPPPKQSVIAR